MKTFGMNPNEDIKLDRFKLEEESEALAAIYDFWADRQADAHSESDKAQTKLNRVLARRELHYRKNPPIDGKVTDLYIKALVQDDSEVQTAQDELDEKNSKLYNLEQLVFALHQKKSGLEYLVNLWERGYYSQEGTRKSEETYDDMRRNRKE